ncbi:hypothetical protein CcaverHIS002_0304440 [Cutaneotrichosporon cavernicola]|uniref:UBA domain-containing protein n=1 Tax=Cutaneotrichosporon cavernicola TaxID=279322 RepID=A0AA48I3C7_9TREE|nr:uncharacterized protein CcaverHIS019_0304410 [Cutaneotrichosporon cavernicola]BEI82576.1 hypothetical protein CcaverHIS002_0304440 [Cutaneotrichosporon cavernicola]BEI90371.1 hypothetical protein CcaverHIS019_0304410 [Cutaneotrichosporon cavernicola]BEI98147.1 hypothetical protein CcaverHIS631_0304460 [Cutaneotrichosporon cavernicola]BEJ05924.1 hypothetical protein CcaverHIS641_0304460 [Cutaneotrichosporon cavernicola]
MDDLLDLSWSEQPNPAAKGMGGSAFDMLSRPQGNYYSGASTPAASKPASNTGSSANLAGMRATPGLRTTASPRPPPVSDAFSGLLGASTAPGGKSLSMAERQAQLAAQKANAAEEERNRWGDDAFWDQLGGSSTSSAAPASEKPLMAPQPAKPISLAPALQPSSTTGSRAASTRPTSATSAKKSAGTFWDVESALGQPDKRKKSPSPPSKGGWGGGDFLNGSKPAPAEAPQKDEISWDDNDGLLGSSSKPTPYSGPADPWDFDALSSSIPAKSAPAVDYGGDDDDLLGELGRPARKPSPRAEPQPNSRPSSRPVSRPASRPSGARASSPPPHVIGQIVEMGFPPDKARAALAATATGEDVQAALESLLASRGGTPARDTRDEEDEWDRERAAARRYEDDERDREAARRARHAARRAGPKREAVRPRAEEYGGPSGMNTDDLTKQAEQVVAQAHEFGATMLSKGLSFWNQGKERAMKAYEDQRKAYDAHHNDGPPTDGRPRWMVEAEEAERGGLPLSHEFGDASLGFKDSDDEGEAPRPKAQLQQARRPEARPEPQRPRTDGPAPPSNVQRISNLLGGEPKKYVSPHRHPKSRASPAPQAAPRATPRTTTPARPPSPLKERALVSAPANALSTAAQHKNVGNEHFKLGRFTEAEAAYSRAIVVLPAGHLHLVPLHNNRAATWLKLGEPARAAADCGTVIELIGAGYHPAKEAALPATPDADGVKLGDALVKATAKRAQAHEMGEKWKLALDDWERVLGYDAALGGAALKGQASDGVRRSKGMLSGPAPAVKATPKATPRATPRPVRPVDVGKSAAVSELRAAAAAAEAEDEQRAALKDGIDAKLSTWRTGKETNIRALLASLDLVLWPEVVLKVGMHELVTDKQVKIKYMKVIARLHPDKLAGATVEQRMMANGVFGTLSEAWAAFNA